MSTRRPDPSINVDNPFHEIQADEVTWILRNVFTGYTDANAAIGKKLDLSVNDMAAIEHLLFDTDLGPVELGHRLGIRSASATAMVDRLEAAGHVQRRPHPTDRRRRTLEVTPSATQSLMGTLGPLVNELSQIAEALSPEHRVIVSNYLQSVVAALATHAEVPND
jgi:DNA-binding MarR family transcriptional regulator